MKKIYTLIAAFISFSMLAGCGDNDIATYSGPEYVQFAQSSGKFGVKEKGNKVCEIMVGTTRPASSDLNLTIDVDTKNSTAIEGRDFRLLTPVATIPAGEMIAIVKVECIYENIPADGVKLVLNILGADELINPKFGNSFTLTLTQQYELTMEKLLGNYTQKNYDPDGKVAENSISIQKVSDTEVELVSFHGRQARIKATVNFDNASISIPGNQVVMEDAVGQDGTKYGNITVNKIVLNGWNLDAVYEKDPIIGECTSNGTIILESWGEVSWSAQAFFAAYERTELVKK